MSEDQLLFLIMGVFPALLSAFMFLLAIKHKFSTYWVIALLLVMAASLCSITLFAYFYMLGQGWRN